MKTKLFTLLFAVAASIGTISAESGTCGENLTWDLTDSVLTIIGTGKMSNFLSYRATPWYQYKDQIRTVRTLYGVTSIGNYAFWGLDKMKEILLAETIDTIGKNSVEDASSLTHISIPKNVKWIGYDAFHIGASLISLEWNAIQCFYDYSTIYRGPVFSGCNAIKSVSIDKDVLSLPDHMFDYTNNMVITSYAVVPPTAYQGTFERVDKSSSTLYVPAASLEAYKAANYWREFIHIVGIPEPIETNEKNVNIIYLDITNDELYSEFVIFNVPVAPEIDGFTFVKWTASSDNIDDGIIIQAIYEANALSSAPEIVTNPSNPAQKLIRNGNVYILTEDKIYTIRGQKVK